MGSLTSQQLANIFGVSLSTVHSWVRKRDLPHHRTLGGQLRFEALEVRKYCEQKKVELPKKLIELTESAWRS